MKKFIFFLLFTFLKANLFIAASSNLSFVLPELIKEFKKEYHIKNVKFTLNSSGILTSQILHKAPYDIFLSADMKHPMFIYKKLNTPKPKVYAYGKIILITKHKKAPLKEVLLKSNKIAIANPKIAPYGKASFEVINKISIMDKIEKKLIYSNSIAGVVNYFLRVCDSAFIAKSLTFSPKLKQFTFIEISDKLYSPIKQGVVLLNQKDETKKFYNFLFSQKAKEIFRQFKYSIGE